VIDGYPGSSDGPGSVVDHDATRAAAAHVPTRFGLARF
jgi:hypothetical protein